MVRYGWYMCFPWYVRLVRLVGTVGTVGSYRTKRTNRTATSVPNVPPNRTDEPCQVKGVKGGRFSGTEKRRPLTPPWTWYGSSVQLCGTFFCLLGTAVWYAWPTVPTVPYQAYKAYQPYRTKRTNRTKRTVPSAPTVPSVPYLVSRRISIKHLSWTDKYI